MHEIKTISNVNPAVHDSAVNSALFEGWQFAERHTFFNDHSHALFVTYLFKD